MQMAAATPAQDLNIVIQAADFAVKYGFLAVGLLLMLLIAPALYKWPKLAIGTAIFGLAFVVAFGVVDLIRVVAPQWLGSQRVIISGAVLGVANGQQVQLRSDLRRPGHAYTKREHDPDPKSANVFNFPFLLVTRSAPKCIALAFENTTGNTEISHVFNITPVSIEDMKANVDILIELGRDQEKPSVKVWREIEGNPTSGATQFFPLKDSDPGCTFALATAPNAPSAWHFIGRASAQAASTSIEELLQSDDVFTRRNARITLSKQGQTGIKKIEELLARDDNYRLQLGAAVAITALPLADRANIPPSVNDKLRSLQKASDKTLRDTAVKALAGP